MHSPFTSSPGKIIIINGPSSSGKTTLALALQKQLDIPFIRFSFDLFMEHKVFPSEQIQNGTFSWEAMRPSVFRGIHQCIPALARAGNNIIFDHIIETKEWLHHLVSLISELDVFFVGLYCSLPELERRESQRGDRHKGEAYRDFQSVHRITSYDLELNSESSLDGNVSLLIQAWKEHERPSVLDRMIRGMKMPSLVIRPVDPQGDDALALLHEAAVEARATYPDLFNPESPWPTNPPTPARGIYLVGYNDEVPVVSGALRPINEHIVEVRRIYVLKTARRSGAARAMLAALEEKAVEFGYKVMRLETGNRQKAAISLYESYGFYRITPFGAYRSDPTSVCFEKGIP